MPLDQPTVIQCPDCDMKLRLKNGVKPGQRVRCPKCESVFSPEVDEPEDERPAPREAIAERPAARRPSRRIERDDDERDEDERERDRDDDDDDEEERRPRLKRRKRPQRGSSLFWVAIAGGAVAAVGLVILLVVLLRSAGGTYGKYEKEVAELVKLMNSLMDAMESVKDRNSARTAAVKINKICDDLEKVADRVKDLPPLSKSDDEKLQKKYGPELEKVNARAFSVGRTAGMNSQGEQSFLQAAQRLQTVGRRLQSIQTRFGK